MKKKALALVLSAAMVLSMAACGNETSTAPAETTPAETTAATEEASEAVSEAATEEAESEVAEVVNEEPHGQLIIGNSTETSGDYTPYWSNASSDYDVFKTVAGQPATVKADRAGIYEYNMDILAEEPVETENEDGTKTWQFKIKEDLKWSNGEPMTAKDFVLTPMLWCSKVATIDLQAINGVTTGERLDGFAAYNAGETETFKGVRLIDDYTFSLTVAAEYMPYYYGMAIVSMYPTYMADFLPEGIDIEDTEEGCKFTGEFTAENIGDQMEFGRWTPTAFCGPYVMEGYNKSSYEYTLSINPNYVGEDGKLPSIQNVIYKYVGQDTMMDQLKTGGVDLLLQLADGTEIDAGLDMVEAGTHDYITYDRNGYGQLIFKCDRGPTQFVEVRQAIAYLLDRNEFTKTFTGGHGTVVNGPYGTAQWMVEEAEDQIETLNNYSYSLDKAVEVLTAGGWTLNAEGGEYAEGDGIRYKDVDGELMPLSIEWCSSDNNSVSDLLVTMLQKNPDVATAGIEINQSVVTFSELLECYYDTKDNNYNMFNMAEGFSVPYDVKQQYVAQSENGDWGYNYNHIGDADLTKYAADMNTVEEGNDEEYLNTWFAFIQRWNELLPNVPLYSNEYLDVFGTKLQNWDRDEIWGVEKALIYATVEE